MKTSNLSKKFGHLLPADQIGNRSNIQITRKKSKINLQSQASTKRLQPCFKAYQISSHIVSNRVKVNEQSRGNGNKSNFNNENYNTLNCKRNSKNDKSKGRHSEVKQIHEIARKPRLSKSKSSVAIHTRNDKMKMSPKIVKQKNLQLKTKIYQKQKNTRNSKEKIKQKFLTDRIEIQKKDKINKPRKKISECGLKWKYSLKGQIFTKYPFKNQRQSKIKNKEKYKIKNRNIGKIYLNYKAKILKKKPCKIVQESIIFSDVSFEDNNLKISKQEQQTFFLQRNSRKNKIIRTEGANSDDHQNTNRMINSAIIIQKNFRGYLTRKYIDEIKCMVFAVTTIQRVWRGYIIRKKLKKDKKRLIIDNYQTLINHSDSFKIQSKSVVLIENNNNNSKHQNRRIDLQEILQNVLQQESSLNSRLKSKIKMSLFASLEHPILSPPKIQNIETPVNKQQYINKKINNQIVSQKIFNSPREVQSPHNRSNTLKLISVLSDEKVAIKNNSNDSLSSINNLSMNSANKITNSNNNKKNQLQIKCCYFSPKTFHSPKNIISLSNNNDNKNNNNITYSENKQQQQEQENKKQSIHEKYIGFQTSFNMIQQFCLTIIQYLRDDQVAMEVFQCKLQNLKSYQSEQLLFKWSQINRKQPNLSFQQLLCNFIHYQKQPQIFTQNQCKMILEYTPIHIVLTEGNYEPESLTIDYQGQNARSSYINLIMSCFSQAIFKQYNNYNSLQIQSIIPLNFTKSIEQVLTISLVLIREWATMLCGSTIQQNIKNIQNKQYNEQIIKFINQQRMIEMINKITTFNYTTYYLIYKLYIVRFIQNQLINQMIHILL